MQRIAADIRQALELQKIELTLLGQGQVEAAALLHDRVEEFYSTARRLAEHRGRRGIIACLLNWRPSF